MDNREKAEEILRLQGRWYDGLTEQAGKFAAEEATKLLGFDVSSQSICSIWVFNPQKGFELQWNGRVEPHVLVTGSVSIPDPEVSPYDYKTAKDGLFPNMVLSLITSEIGVAEEIIKHYDTQEETDKAKMESFVSAFSEVMGHDTSSEQEIPEMPEPDVTVRKNGLSFGAATLWGVGIVLVSVIVGLALSGGF